MKKFLLKAWIFWQYLMHGMKATNDIAFGSTHEGNLKGAGIEEQKHQDSVYQDLMREKVTDEVRELRHEMYFSERESKKYQYKGGGRGNKKNKFSYQGNVECSDGYEIQIVQPNIEDTGGVASNIKENDIGKKGNKSFTIKINRDFLPKFKLEEYSQMIVVKRVNDEEVLLDLYSTKYESQFNRTHRLFLNELERIYEGDKRSDILDFKELKFISYNAYGTDDLKEYCYNNINFLDIMDFDGFHVLRFSAKIAKDGEDLIAEYYDEKTAQKCENKEMRKTAQMYWENAVEDKYNINEAEQTINEFKRTTV